MKRTGLIALAVLVTVFLAGAEMASALEPIPQKSGFSGFIRPAVGYIKYTRHLGEPVISATVSAKSCDIIIPAGRALNKSISITAEIEAALPIHTGRAADFFML